MGFAPTSSRRQLFRSAALGGLALAAIAAFQPVQAQDTVKLGLVAALSGTSAVSGEAITRGLTIAMEEINAAGGILGGKKIALIRRDDESNPGKGVAAARELIFSEKVAAFFGGIDTPVSFAIVPLANQQKVPFMGVWAAGTGITRNKAEPNYVFRVSAMDVLVDKALIAHAKAKFSADQVGLMLINNPWGESNQVGLTAAAEEQGVKIVGIEKFEASDVDMVAQLTRLKQAGAKSLILVSNAAPAAQMIKSMDRMGWDVPVVSHWGISGGRFTELAGPTAEKVHFIQTYSFFGEQSPTGKKVLDALMAKYSDVKGPGDVIAPVGTANAYDAMHLLAKAIDKAGSTDGDAIRKALESLGSHQGLIKTYNPAFTATEHDALNEKDYVMVRFKGDQIVPID
ncbi:ABC transporter substrate-binding protein [Oceanibaculum pacificum]|uniref:Ethanolamine utilization protein EutN n=1 Tax=Oceanibaculum pacificum TaxID=580166 RepID=A0A154WEZ6_9PROT|nr:ABC transporter substrate-binding protein [Oceanibaculum pacificum]KZD12069.1 ethanolamine utilization protein EutN [Oceanibaculum pacificum]